MERESEPEGEKRGVKVDWTGRTWESRSSMGTRSLNAFRS
jgi:hypothetical protein